MEALGKEEAVRTSWRKDAPRAIPLILLAVGCLFVLATPCSSGGSGGSGGSSGSGGSGGRGSGRGGRGSGRGGRGGGGSGRGGGNIVSGRTAPHLSPLRVPRDDADGAIMRAPVLKDRMKGSDHMKRSKGEHTGAHGEGSSLQKRLEGGGLPPQQIEGRVAGGAPLSPRPPLSPLSRMSRPRNKTASGSERSAHSSRDRTGRGPRAS